VQPEQNTKLFRSYCHEGAAAVVMRHRGKSPRQAAFFFRNPEVTFYAAQLASLFLVYGLARCEDCGGVRLRALLARNKEICGNCEQGSPGPSH
jgi:hypothetical protein